MKKLVIGWGIVAAILGVQLAAFYGVENSRGRKAWAEYQREALARGDRLDISDFEHPPIPDEENFAATPFLQSIFRSIKEGEEAKTRVSMDPAAEGTERPRKQNWSLGKSTDLAAWKKYLGTDQLRDYLTGFEPILDEISAAGSRPKTRFPLDMRLGAALPLPHGTVLMRLSDLLQLRARVALEEEKPEEALKDVDLILRLGETSTSQPFVIHLLIDSAINGQALGVIWDGLALHRWNKPDLTHLKIRLGQIDMIARARQAMLVDRAFVNLEWELIRQSPDRIQGYKGHSYYKPLQWLRYAPAGWGYQNQVTSNRVYKQYSDAFTLLPIQPEDFVFKYKNPYVYHMLASTDPEIRVRGAIRAVFIQNGINQALVACALEEYRLDHGALPETLDDLVPQYVDALPLDPMTAKPHLYRLTDNGSYLLYSIGWNGKDDGGTVALKKGNRQDDEEADWLWFGSPQS